MKKTCVLTTLGNDPHTQGLYKVSRIARRAGIEPHILPPGTPESDVMEAIHRLDATYVGLSYRMSPEVGLRQLIRFLSMMDRDGLIRRADGTPRKIAFAGLPETMRAVTQSKGKLPCAVHVMPQDNDPLESATRVVAFFDVAGDLRKSILNDLRAELYPPTIPELGRLAKEVVADDTYKAEPALPGPSEAAKKSFTRRIRESNIPLIRTHFGIPADSIRPTVEGVRKLAEAAVVDEISLGSSDLSQRYFGLPDEFAGRKNDGGVPYKTVDDLLELVEAARRGNLPGMKPYAHVVDLVGFIDTCVRAGMLTGAHQAIPLYWFNELDGRGPMSVPESLREHVAAVKELARRGIPVEMNEPNQWSSRWAHDAIIVADYGLIAAVMAHCGAHDLIFQLQFNKPRETGDLADLAKMTAGLQLAKEMIPPATGARGMWRQTRTGIEYLDPDPALAKFQLARSTFLQMIVSPHVIHLVSYCEADHAASAEDVIDSSRLVRRCVRIFAEHREALLTYLDDSSVVGRRESLLEQARLLLRRIAHLNVGCDVPDNAPMSALVPWLADPDTLVEALRRRAIAAPGIFHPEYVTPGMTTGTTPSGGIDCLDPDTALPVSEQVRLSRLGL